MTLKVFLPSSSRLSPPQTESAQSFVIRALEDSALEGEESFTVRLLPGTSAAVIDPLAGQWVRGLGGATPTFMLTFPLSNTVACMCVYIYIYIYMCVCVCVCVYLL